LILPLPQYVPPTYLTALAGFWYTPLP